MIIVTNFLNNSTIKKQIITIISAGVIITLFTTTLNSILIANNKIKSIYITQGKNISETLATNSDLALLYESKENAEAAVSIALSFPDVDQLSIFTKSMDVLTRSGNNDSSFAYHLLHVPDISEPTLIFEDNNYWHFAAPVISKTDDMNNFLYQPTKTNKTLGYVYIIINKTSLSEIKREIHAYNLAISIFMATILVLVLSVIINRITHPLKIISNAIKNTYEFKKIKPDGPPEIRHIATTYNSMIETIAEKDLILRNHNMQLEHEVTIRTAELRKKRDEAISANRHKSEFVTNITHELRTPLQSIIGYCDLTIEELHEANHDHLIDGQNRILENSKKLLFLINNLLDLSRLESGKMEINLNNYQVDNITSTLEYMIRPLLTKNNNTLIINRNYDNTTIVIDHEKIHQILLNLLSNANKFTTNGTIELSISFNKSHLVISVKDTGPGISADQLKLIFEPFHQADSSLTREFSGTGLGLAITNQLCNIMGGSISVESEIDKGSCFTVKIPYTVST